MKKFRKSKQKAGDVSLSMKSREASGPLQITDATMHKRQLVADLCRLVGSNLQPQRKERETPAHQNVELPKLSPRMQQTLQRLLAGDSEKQIACHLGLSKHTIHVYVKALYRGFNVNSRGELLARFVHAPNVPPTRSKNRSAM